jgi:rubrerythrin
MDQPRFTRNIEDFTCEKCGHEVKGNGYTNHCPKCLWSKHVDVNPGDRLAKCGGMMEPVTIEAKDGGQIIVHKCIKCGYQKKNKAAKEDDFDVILKIASRELRA